jgi:hypothetical protein
MKPLDNQFFLPMNDVKLLKRLDTILYNDDI